MADIQMNQGKKKDKWIMWSVRGILTALLAGFLLAVWPGYLVYDEAVLGIANGTDLLFTEVLAGDIQIVQFFSPQKEQLSGIEFAMEFNSEKAGGYCSVLCCAGRTVKL